MSTEPVISLRDVTFSYGGEPALEDVNLSVDEREAVCIVGPNGGGKTTLVKLILGLLTPQRGEVRVFGQPPAPGPAPRRLHAAARAARPAVSRHGDGHRADGPAGPRRTGGRAGLARTCRPPRRARRPRPGRHGGFRAAAVRRAFRRAAAAGADRPGAVLQTRPAAAGRAHLERRLAGRGPAAGFAAGR